MDYQSNSRKDKESNPEKPDKKIEKVVTGEVLQKPKSNWHKFKDIFVGGDAKTAGRYVLSDVLLPALRNMAWDMISEGSRRVIFGESSNRRGVQTEYRPRVQYNNPLARRDLRPMARLPDQPSVYRAVKRDANDIILASRDEAELVIERLIDIIDKYDVASVADLYELLGLPTSHIDNKWGWTYLNNVEVRQVRNGYLIDLPSLEEI